MHAGLDLSELSDDQVVELATALAQEALRRTPALAAAFEQALVTERERVEAELRGTKAAKAAEMRAIEERARNVRTQQSKEELRQQNCEAMAGCLRSAAAIAGREAAELTLVWHRKYYSRGPRLHLNAGTTGEDASWHLAEYDPDTQTMRTSPGLKKKTTKLLQWARETCAVAAALNLDRLVVQGAVL